MAAGYRPTILLVDDNKSNIFALERLLDNGDRIFVSAANGNEALRIALNDTVDLIILDVQMPEMDGFEVAQILKSSKKTRDIPIIFASAIKKDHQFIVKGFEEGAIDYLSKPLDPEITKAKVSVFLQLQLQKKELIEKNKSLLVAKEEIKQLNSELQKNVVQLKSTNAELETFSYSVSHDLKAPLRAISGYSKILDDKYKLQLDEEARRLLGKIQKNAYKMSNLISSLLEFSKIGKKEVAKTELDMNELVNKLIEDINGFNPAKAVIEVQDLFPACADRQLLTNVWTNLISNAIKYSSKKSAPQVTIGCTKTDEEVIYFVKDNGIGFDMEYAGKLFGVFERLHGNEFEGSGIGLAIVQRIIMGHNGRVWAEGVEGEGSTFYFSLPRE